MSSKKIETGLNLTGLLNLHKPPGITSRQVVNQIQKQIKPVKVGHAGTLDPLATGVLVACIGSATRLIRFVQDQPKEYIGEFLLGKRSDTDDISGNVIETPDCPPITREQLESCLPDFLGQIEQVPPQYSAVHIDGRRAYDRARGGETFEIQPRTVEVYEIELTAFQFPMFQLRIVCGSGTYIRSIGRDLGEQLGTGATMSSLVRTRIGQFHLNSAMKLDEDLSLESITQHLQPATLAVTNLPQYQCNEQELLFLSQGRKLKCHSDRFPDTNQITEIAVMTQDGTLAAIAEWDQSIHQLSPRQVYYQRSS
ncbi:tRNA pseudouridine(55) synthase TruB [uncultured Gimesia sp.]|uniref:tRNA pseudouridine(55) synthase TruB n=1 Tax=uncultured Gimesia sp. TaxID=1678688 RepID=UPI0030DC05A2|tara:strand:- start:237465 stop:238394 length:930 start_codon:yes stop_codon:yes gene_type:complete